MSETHLTERLEEIVARFESLERQLSDPDVASDHQKIMELSQQRSALESMVALYRQYKSKQDEAAHLSLLVEGESDEELRGMARAELEEVEHSSGALLERIKRELVTGEDRAVGSVILELRAGVGGDEAGIWAGDLLAMYERYATQKGWKWTEMQFSAASKGGVKNAAVNVKGEGVWLHLGYEGGTHCVKRVPETEAQGRVHTSTATVAVLPEPRDVDVVIRDEDVKIDVTTARGPGGQNVNKVATAIKMIHVPTGIEVRMQETKSQHQNKQLAWQILRARVYEHHQKVADARRSQERKEMIGRAERSERIRTYRWKDNIVVDHRLGASFNLREVMAGEMEALTTALIERDQAQRLATL